MKSRRILIAHDQNDIRERIRKSIRSIESRIEIDMTGNGYEAIEWFYESTKQNNRPYDLVILGTNLSVYDGIDALLVMLFCRADANIFVCWSQYKSSIEKIISERKKENKELCGVHIKDVSAKKIKYLDLYMYKSELMKELNMNTPKLSPISPLSLNEAIISTASPTLKRPISPFVLDQSVISPLSTPGYSHLGGEVQQLENKHQVIQKPQEVKVSQSPLNRVGHFVPENTPTTNTNATKSKWNCCF